MDANALYELGTEGRVLYIRHGETHYNQESKKNPLIAKANPSYIDSHLTPMGIAQANKVAEKLSKFAIRKIYSSPLFRCLQTAFYALEHHPNVESIIVYVHPLLTEIIGGIQDWNHDTKGKKAKFNLNSKVKFDWSLFDLYYKTDIEQELFCLKESDIMDDSYRNYIKETEELFIKENYKDLPCKISEIITEGLIKRKHFKFETMNHVFKRTIEFKQFLLKELNHNANGYSNGENAKDTTTTAINCSTDSNENKIIVFSHSGIVKISTSKSAYTMKKHAIDVPKDIYEIKNCECISMIINSTNCTYNK